MKLKETITLVPAGLAMHTKMTRVYEHPDDEPIPEGHEVTDEEVHDFRGEK